LSLFTRLARNSLWLLVARIGVQDSMVIITYLLARRLGVAGFGEYAFMATAIFMGNSLTTFGSDMYLIREIAATTDLSLLSSALILQLTLSILFITFVFVLAPYLPNQTSETVLALRVYSLALIPLAFFTVFTSALRGCQKMDSYAWLNLVTSILQVTAIFLFIQRGTSVVTLAYLLLVLQIAGTILAGTLCGLYIPEFWRAWHFSSRATIRLFRMCFPIAGIAILGILYQKLSLTMLAILGSAATLGWFSAAARVVEAARIGHIAILTALYPAMANADVNKGAVKAFQLPWLLLMVGAIGIAILLFVIAKPLVDIFFGPEYLPSVPVLKILALTLLPYAINSFLALAFLAERKEKVVVRALLVSLIILVTMNIWLIPRAGLVGAGWAMLIAEVIQAAFLLFKWRINRTQMDPGIISQKGVSYELPDLPR